MRSQDTNNSSCIKPPIESCKSFQVTIWPTMTKEFLMITKPWKFEDIIHSCDTGNPLKPLNAWTHFVKLSKSITASSIIFLTNCSPRDWEIQQYDNKTIRQWNYNIWPQYLNSWYIHILIKLKRSTNHVSLSFIMCSKVLSMPCQIFTQA